MDPRPHSDSEVLHSLHAHSRVLDLRSRLHPKTFASHSPTLREGARAVRQPLLTFCPCRYTI